jgi:DNA-binding NarL/FixJ family response regulator
LTQSGRIRVVGEAEDGRRALEVIALEQPQVALVDYQMPDMDGIAVVRTLKSDDSATRVLLLSALTDSAIVFQALEEGASGYLAKDSSRAEIVDAVIRVAKGETVVPQALTVGLRDLARALSERGRITNTIVAESWDESWRPSPDGLLLATAREFLTNVVKHASAHAVDIELSWRDGIARLRIADDGRGISPGEIEQQLGLVHTGLTSRRVRLEAAGGSPCLHPGKTSGTVAVLEVPAALQAS